MIRSCIIALCVIALAGCSGRFLQDGDLAGADKLLKQKKYTEAAGSYDKISREAAGTDRGAVALFEAARVRTSYDNPHRDYATALQKFDEFVRKYPNSEMVYDAQSWRSILKAIVELKKENEQLTKSIEQLQKIDVRHEERRKGK